MKKKIALVFYSILAVCLISLTFTSCDMLSALLGGEGGDGAFLPTNEQMITALKEALSTGSADAGATLSVVGAFNNPDNGRRIPLPPEVNNAVIKLNTLPSIPEVPSIPGYTDLLPANNLSAASIFNAIGGQKALNDLQTDINASAEEASKDVAGAFSSAITSMTFSDALTILKGVKGTEATDYLVETTKVPLKNAFKNVLDPVLNKPLLFTVSANTAWDNLTTKYNNCAKDYNNAVDLYNNAANKFNNLIETNILAAAAAQGLNLSKRPIINSSLDGINTDLGDFILEKALTEVFKEMAVVEKKIRDDPLGFLSDVIGALTDIAKKVFEWAKGLI